MGRVPLWVEYLSFFLVGSSVFCVAPDLFSRWANFFSLGESWLILRYLRSFSSYSHGISSLISIFSLPSVLQYLFLFPLILFILKSISIWHFLFSMSNLHTISNFSFLGENYLFYSITRNNINNNFFSGFGNRKMRPQLSESRLWPWS